MKKEGIDHVAYVLNITTQHWLTEKQVDRTLWYHILVVCVPHGAHGDTGMIYIDGKSNKNPPPTSMDPIIEVTKFYLKFISLKSIFPKKIICLSSQTVTSHLLDVPNQPLVFNQDGVGRSEDGLIAYTWRRFINESGSNPYWLARLPMTKSVVVAMNIIQNFTSYLQNVPRVEKFVVAGASKRGWTTWTTGKFFFNQFWRLNSSDFQIAGIVDDRVVALVPIVIP